MKPTICIRLLTFFAACLLLLQTGCKYETPVSAWEKAREKEKIVPVVTRVEPQVAGAASELTIIGEGFSSDTAENKVYFKNKPAILKSASPTQIVVYRPDVVGEALSVNVVVNGAISVAKFSPYKLEAVVEDFGNFAGQDAFLAAAVDGNENVYLAMGSTDVVKLNSDGSTDLNFSGTTNNSLWTDMKVGSDNNLYLARSNNIIYTLPIAGGAAVEFLKFSDRNDRIKSIDFNENGNLYGGGKNSDLIVIRSQTDFQKLGQYTDYEIVSLRVFTGYVYVAARYLGAQTTIPAMAIWRNLIQGDGSVGDKELVLDWTMTPYGAESINTIIFSQNGTIYISTTHSDKPILMFYPGDNSFKLLFYGITPSPVDQLVWGNSTYQYAVVQRSVKLDSGGRLIRINAGEVGAPCYGR